MVLDSQLLHKIVNLLFKLVIAKNKLLILRGWTFSKHLINTFCEIRFEPPSSQGWREAPLSSPSCSAVAGPICQNALIDKF